ncbi:MAG: polysaccharide deacetylase family protein [Ilumatobacter sp.]|nr:polysaccharide deacetylase family protein [Ilumatobacter sp.]
MTPSRRQFLKFSAGVGVGLVGGARFASAQEPPPDPVDPIDPIDPMPVMVRADALDQATRGQQVQINPPPPPPPANRWSPGDFISNVVVENRHMAFTFDDGPSPSNTYTVLRALRDRGAKATFFLVGVNVRAWPQIARDIVSEGHELGNHSIYHTPYRASSLASQIRGNQSIIQQETGVVPVVHRAPGLTRGSSILFTCAQENLYECHTHMGTSDYVSPRWSSSRLISQFSSNLRNGSFPIYHDGGPSRPTRYAVGAMVDIALARGYGLHTATGLVNIGTPVPGRQSYPFLSRADAEHAGHDVNCCPYDARAGLLERLENPTVKHAERSRIVEQLAMFDDHLKLEGE